MIEVVQGIDISAVQGRLLPLAKEKDRGAKYVSFRCQVGNDAHRDAFFEDNVRIAMDVGLIYRPYQFYYALSHIDPLDQADGFALASRLDDVLIGTQRGELGPALDLEWPPPEEWQKRGCSDNQIVDGVLKCLARMREHWNRLPRVYSYPWYLQSLSKAYGFMELVTTYELWIAGGNQYLNGDGHVPDLTKEHPPHVAGWGPRWKEWQFDGNGGRRLTNGIDADFNVYNGTLEDLEREAGWLAPLDETIPDTFPAMPFAINDMIIEDAVHAYRQERAQRILDAA